MLLTMYRIVLYIAIYVKGTYNIYQILRSFHKCLNKHGFVHKAAKNS